MFEDFTITGYAATTRYTNGQLESQSNVVLRNKQLVSFVESISQMVLILNQFRQVIYANKSYKDFCKTINHDPVLGKRPGETFNCRNAFKSAHGCGASASCKNCGALNAISESKKGSKTTKECQVLTTSNDAIELKVTATPLELDGEKLTIFSVLDISAENRRKSLERVFIHDILNSAGAISGLSSILKEIDDPAEILDIATTIEGASINLIDEIKAQRELGSAERGDLKPNFFEIDALFVLEEQKKLYTNHEINLGKPISIHSEAKNINVNTDSILLKRILGNMIKNAIEASCHEDEITLNCVKVNEKVRFSVHNKSVIPEQIQDELFKRFYSTKGSGRGIGTYSMKLLGEKYLYGRVWFTSNHAEGTTFYVEL